MIELDSLIFGLAMLGVAWLFVTMWRRMKRCAVDAASEGLLLCRSCGYDLRANVDRCPECGTTIPVPEYYDAILARYPRLNDAPVQRIDPRRPDPDETPLVVWEVDSYRVALLAAEQLGARGVASWSEPHPEEGLKLDPTEPSVVVVWSGDAEHARQLVGLLLQPRPNVPEAVMN